MKFSYSAIWDDTVRMLKSHGSLVLALAGVFFFLPELLIGYFVPAPTDETPTIAALMAYYRENSLVLLLKSLVNALGAVSMYLLLFDQKGRTVGSAIGAALPLFIFYFITAMLVTMAVSFGFLLLIIPGIYLLGRLAISGPVLVAENRKNPLDAIGGSWRLTQGNGWAIAGLIVIVSLAGMILTFAITAILGSIFILIGGREGVGGLLVLILTSALTAGLYTVVIVLLAAIYRRLSGPEASVPSTA